jgi:hypothetical protein
LLTAFANTLICGNPAMRPSFIALVATGVTLAAALPGTIYYLSVRSSGQVQQTTNTAEHKYGLGLKHRHHKSTSQNTFKPAQASATPSANRSLLSVPIAQLTGLSLQPTPTPALAKFQSLSIETVPDPKPTSSAKPTPTISPPLPVKPAELPPVRTPTPAPKTTPTPDTENPISRVAEIENNHKEKSGEMIVDSTDMPTMSDDHYIVVIENKSQRDLWPAAFQLSVMQKTGPTLKAERSNPDVLGREEALKPNQKSFIAIPLKAMQIQIIPRAECKGSGSSFRCLLGDCGGVQCSQMVPGGRTSILEVGACPEGDKWVGGAIAYDISNIDVGRDAAIGIRVFGTAAEDKCPQKDCPPTGCSSAQSWLKASDINQGSPADTVCKTKSLTVQFYD